MTAEGEKPKGSESEIAQTTRFVAERLNGRPIVLVGMMGAGKTTVGRRLANRLGWHFVDSDTEIEAAAGMSIPDFFAAHGEQEFRSGEAKVIARLLGDKQCVLGTGGGAFMNETTRDLIARKAVSVWIKADFEVLFARVSKRSNRPLLQTKNPRQTLKKLLAEREPVYALADISITSSEVPHEEVVDTILRALEAHLSAQRDPTAHASVQDKESQAT